MCPASTDRVVQMVGPIEYVLQCLQKLTEMLETAPPKGPRNNYDARNYDEYSATEYGGFHSNRTDGGLGESSAGLSWDSSNRFPATFSSSPGIVDFANNLPPFVAPAELVTGAGLIGRSTGTAGPGIAGSSAMGPLNPGGSVGGTMRG